MTTTVTVPESARARRFNAHSFADITPLKVLTMPKRRGVWEITFDGNLSVAKQAEVVAFLTSRNDVERTLRDRAKKALADNRKFLALEQPTEAQKDAHLERMTRQMQAVLRMALAELDDTD